MMDTKDRIQIIDAIKGLAIISVILLHILPGIVLFLSSFLFLSIYLLKELRIEVILF